jgi:cytochrome c peroxidase
MALGDRLFHDPRLSHNNTLSCNSCHDTATNGAKAAQAKSGAVAAPGLNTPTVFNAALNFRLNWEGDLRTLESHVEQTLRNPGRMGSSLDEALKKLRADQDLSKEFSRGLWARDGRRGTPRRHCDVRAYAADAGVSIRSLA